GGAFFKVDYFFFSGAEYGRIWYIVDYPNTLSPLYWRDLMDYPANVRLVMHVTPLDARLIHQPLRHEYTQLQAGMLARQQRGQIPDFAEAATANEVGDMLEAIEVRREPFYNLTLLYMVMATSRDELERHSQAIEDLYKDAGLKAFRASALQEPCLHSVLPYGKAFVNKPRNMNAQALAGMFPFDGRSYADTKGIFYGINRANNTVVVVDDFAQENYNMLVLGIQGAGKSMLLKWKTEQALVQGVRCFVIDLEGEFKPMCDDLGGTYMDMALTSNAQMNVMDVDCASRETMQDSYTDFMGWLSVACGGLTQAEFNVAERGYVEVLKRHGIDKDDPASSHDQTPPTLSEWYATVKQTEGKDTDARSLLAKAYTYAVGMQREAFDCQTNVQLDNPLVVFGLKTVTDERLRVARIRQIQSFLWSNILRDLKPTMIVVDEAWHLMREPWTAQDLEAMARRGRKKYVGLTLATQYAEDFLSNPHARAIVSTAAMTVLMRQKPSSVAHLQALFALSGAEVRDLMVMTPGQAILTTGQFKVPIQVIIPESRYPLYTTKPQEVLELQRAAREKGEQPA
ncbi:MAG: hypothetical protein ABI874_13150, partial [Chloroflexota bacterium]